MRSLAFELASLCLGGGHAVAMVVERVWRNVPSERPAVSQTRRLWLAVMAGISAVLLCLLEAVLATGVRAVLDLADPQVQAGVVIACGIGLLVGGPFGMRWENRDRVADGHKRRYGPMAFMIVIVAGIVFTGVGVRRLVG